MKKPKCPECGREMVHATANGVNHTFFVCPDSELVQIAVKEKKTIFLEPVAEAWKK